MGPADWARKNRIYPPSAAIPGPRNPSLTPYIIPIEEALVAQRYRRVVAVFGTQMSKALSLDTRLPTPSGWTTMGKVQPGDRLFDESGEPCLVTGISPVMLGRVCYRVEFCDGSSIAADAGHLWTVQRAHKVPSGIERRTETLTTQDMIDVGVARSGGAARFSIPVSAPLRCDESSLPVDPYVLGAWLGDGNSRCTAISVGDEDLDDMVAMLEDRGVETSIVRERTCNRVSFFGRDASGARVPRGAAGNLQKQLRVIGVLRNKHIPISYLRSSEESRWALLRGLMDTDGTPNGGTCRFAVVSKPLADGMVELLSSLGFRPRMRTRVSADGYTVHQAEFRAYRDQPVFGLSRKQERLPVEGVNSRRHLSRQRYIRAITPIDSRPVKCIAVSSASSLFLAGERMIPTHNTELAMDVIGHRMDTNPVPTAFVMPSKDLLTESIEPRIKDLIAQSSSLSKKQGKKGQTLSKKTISGVPIRLIPAGSPTPLSSQSFGLVVTDEVDKFVANVKKQGSVVGLADRRGDAYGQGFVHFSTSSPTIGFVDTEFDPVSELRFWSHQDPDQLQSTIWRMWQSGSRHHWAWPCPHCSNYWIPRFRDVIWDKPKNAKGEDLPSTPSLAARTARFVCEHCGEDIRDDAIVASTDQATKEWMNERGRFVAPGQAVMNDGTVNGEPEETWSLSYWVSGLCSPFVSWATRVGDYVEAKVNNAFEDLQTVVNGMGETYSAGSDDAPKWSELAKLRIPYRQEFGEVPEGVKVLVLTADVQKDSIYYVIRGYGASDTSWLIAAEQILGDTSRQKIWDDLAVVLTDTYDGLPIKLGLVDSGYRPGKKFVVPENMVYKFCRKFKGLAYATKGSSHAMRKPIGKSSIDIKLDGKQFKKGIELRILDTGFFKRDLHLKFFIEGDQLGAWFLPEDITDDYLEQMISEVEVKLSNGRSKWVQRTKDNHYFDCESMQRAASMMLNLRLLRDGPVGRRRLPRPGPRKIDKPNSIDMAEVASAPETEGPRARKRKRKGSDTESIW